MELAAGNREASLDVDKRSWGRATPSKGMVLDTSSEKDIRGERSGTVRRL
jgi:hypothetical protein